MFFLATLLFFASAPFALATAIPATAAEQATPEVIPGPGLPSLAELGVTSAELYKKTPAESKIVGKRAALFNNFCGGGRGDTANVDDVIACFNYLERLGHTACVIPPDGNQHIMCSAGTARINGVDATSHTTSSYCSDVALGVQWVFTNCNNGGQVEGDAAANGNGDLIVVVGGPL